jgi:hypothetical protein
MPHLVADLVGEQQFGDDLSHFSLPDVPYLEPGGKRHGPTATIIRSPESGRYTGRYSYAVPGRASTLHLDPQPGTPIRILTYRDGRRWVQRDVSGLDSVTIKPAGFLAGAQVECLAPGKDGKSWTSLVKKINLHQRGVAPLALILAESPKAGEERGRPLRSPFGAFTHTLAPGKHVTLVTDREDQVLCIVDREGLVRDLCGARGQAGFEDGPGNKARFRNPTYLAAETTAARGRIQSKSFLVVDSGNCAIRRVSLGWDVHTLAGTGKQGYHDDPVPTQAQFWDPRGIAVAWDGTVYVADKDTLRRIAPPGDVRIMGVSTLAGVHQEPGARDGSFQEARFTDLKGILLDEGADPRHLYVLDGHALRVVDLRERTVATLVGQVDRPGFQAPGKAGLREPLLRDPMALAWSRRHTPEGKPEGRLFISDTGNHVLQAYDTQAGTLVCLAGDREIPSDQPGGLRELLPAGTPVDPSMGGLSSPLCLAVTYHGDTSGFTQRICTSRGMVEMMEKADTATESLGEIQAEVPEAVAGQPWVMTLAVPVKGLWKHPLVFPLSYSVEFLEPDGSAAGEPGKGKATTCKAFTLIGTFAKAGTAKVRVTLRLENGDLLRREWDVKVKAKPGSDSPAGSPP